MVLLCRGKEGGGLQYLHHHNRQTRPPDHTARQKRILLASLMWRGRASTAMALATLLPSSTSCYEVQRQHSLHAQQLLSNQTAATASPAQPGSAVNLSLHGPPKGPLPEQQQQPIRIDAISSPPPPDAKITGPLDYTTAHAGFMTAIAVLLLLPVLIFIGCYV